MINLNSTTLSSSVLANLQSFSSAAKHLSFTLAAEELNLTQGAVSHRIKKLEEQLGFTLFMRFNRRLQLTPEGERLLLQTNTCLTELNNVIRDIHTDGLVGELVISAPPSFTSNWLLPRLPEFCELHPHISIRMESHSRLIDFFAERIDLAIYYGQSEHPGLCCWTFMEETLMPVCTKAFAEQHQLWNNPSRLNQCYLLHDAEAWPEAGPFSEWSYWASQHKIHLALKQNHCFDKSEHAVKSALSGLGIAIGRYSLIKEELENGKLINPFSQLPTVKSQQSYRLVTHESRKSQPIIKAFRKWLLGITTANNH